MILNGYQLMQALEFICPDEDDKDQLETQAKFIVMNEDFKCPSTGEIRPKGIYVGLEEYPDEGSIYLSPEKE